LEQKTIGWNEVTQGMVGGERKIKDVCAKCNNSALSELDAYGKQLLVGNGLLGRNYPKRTLTLHYDYGMLLRWLLKISFNSSRADGAHSPLFEPFVPFMMGKAVHPMRGEVACLGYLAAPEQLGASRIAEASFLRLSEGSRLLNPFFVRICYGAVPGEDAYTLRFNIFGPAVFALLLFRTNTPPGFAASAVRRFQKKALPGAIELDPRLRVLELTAGSRTWLDLYEQQVLRAQRSAGGPDKLHEIISAYVKK